MTDRPTDRPAGLAQSVPEGRCLLIGDNIRIWVADARGGTARLVIDAPDNLTITRPRHDAEA